MPRDLVRAPEHDRARSLGLLAVHWFEHFMIHGLGDVQGISLDPAVPGALPLSDELARFTIDAYALDRDGRRLYDSAFYSRPKGADKSGHFTRLGLFEAMGPCRFAGFARGGEVYEQMDFRHVYAPGEPMGAPITYPFLRVLATEETQTGNVYDSMVYILKEGPLSAAFAQQDDIGITRTFLPGGGEIRPSTASSAAKDGGKETWVNFDETHLYTRPELRRMYATVRRNLAKRKEAEPWSGESSTMYEPGMDSVAEATHALAVAIKAGKVRRPRLLFDHREAPADWDLAEEVSLRAGLAEAYGDAAAYMDFDRLVTEIWDPRNDVQDSRRFYGNQATASRTAWTTPQEFDVLARPEVVIADRSLITLGFDGSMTDDHSVLYGCDVETNHRFVLGVWRPEDYPTGDGGGEIPRLEVDAAVMRAFERFDVVGFLSDVHPFEAYLDVWEQRYSHDLCVKSSALHPIAWDMRGRGRETTQMIEELHAAIVAGDFTHDGDPIATQHFHNARRQPNNYGVTVAKESRESPLKIDGVPSMGLAQKARQMYLALPKSKQRRKRTGRASFV